MISLDILGHYLLHIKVIHSKHLGNLLKSYKTRKISRLHPLEVIMGVSLKTKILNYSVMNMVLNTIFLHLEPLNKMELLRGKIGHWKKLQELY